ncbi:MAG TPA: VWA domain-containing protein [Bryobacteraceae bacterium]|nr:VWA domain-containing protein [Bryobacteraceae bacterium]
MFRLYLLPALLCASPLVIPAQQPAPHAASKVEERAQSPITVDVNRVNMMFTVADKRGRFITNLGRDDIEIIEGKRPQNIIEFAAESDLPLRLAIVIDTSNSIRERFRFQQDAAVEFIKSAMRPQDKAVVIAFDTGAELITDMTSDTAALERGIRNLRPGGGTALYEAIYFAARDKLAQDQPLHKFRRAMVILSDGEDNQSRYTREQALEMTQKADAVVYTISTNISRIETDGDKIMKYLARETGGVAFFPFKVQDLAQSFENIANELRHQYSILYRPEPAKNDGLWHPVDIRVKNRKDLVVRARKGYYAPRG